MSVPPSQLAAHVDQRCPARERPDLATDGGTTGGGSATLFHGRARELEGVAPGAQLYVHDAAGAEDLAELEALIAPRRLRLEAIGPRWFAVRWVR